MGSKGGTQTQACQRPGRDSMSPALFSISDPKALIPKSLISVQLTQGICDKYTPQAARGHCRGGDTGTNHAGWKFPKTPWGPQFEFKQRNAYVQTSSQTNSKEGTWEHLASVS